jgi:hypothetical protein
VVIGLLTTYLEKWTSYSKDRIRIRSKFYFLVSFIKILIKIMKESASRAMSGLMVHKRAAPAHDMKVCGLRPVGSPDPWWWRWIDLSCSLERGPPFGPGWSCAPSLYPPAKSPSCPTGKDGMPHVNLPQSSRSPRHMHAWAGRRGDRVLASASVRWEHGCSIS